MKDADKQKILKFLTGKLLPLEFESWVFEETELESRIRTEVYEDLIAFNYKNKDIIHVARKSLVDKYISEEELKEFQFINVLKQAGWSKGRSEKSVNEKLKMLPIMKNAFEIISEYGGLKLNRLFEAKYWTPRNIEFLDNILESMNVEEYGINKFLIQFASIDDGNSTLFVDDENNFYQLDSISSVELYRFKEKNFNKLMFNLLGMEDKYNFEFVGRKSVH